MNIRNVTHWFFKLDYASGLKNKLQKDVLEYLKNLDGNIIDASELETVKSEIINSFATIIAINKNCNVPALHFWFDGGRYIFMGIGAIKFYIYPGTQTHHTTFAYKSPSNN